MSEPNENTTMPEWQKHSVEMSLDFFKYVLEPIAIFSEMLRGYNNDDDLTIQ